MASLAMDSVIPPVYTPPVRAGKSAMRRGGDCVTIPALRVGLACAGFVPLLRAPDARFSSLPNASTK